MRGYSTGIAIAALAAIAAVPQTSPDRPMAVEPGSDVDHARTAPGAPGIREVGVVVDLSMRQLDIRVDGKLYGTYEVAVGAPDHRTPTGTYTLDRVIWNPAWVPPDSEWAEDEERTPPGDPDNPMGRVKIYFDDLLYIHGTDATETLGEPASHGCIRMRNNDAMELARLVMEHGGAAHDEQWYEKVRENETETYEVDIPDPPVLRITD